MRFRIRIIPINQGIIPTGLTDIENSLYIHHQKQKIQKNFYRLNISLNVGIEKLLSNEHLFQNRKNEEEDRHGRRSR